MGIKIFSFFAGTGFLDSGFEKTGSDIVYVNEIFKPFLDAYKFSRKRLKLAEPDYGYHLVSVTDLLNGKNNTNLKSLVQAQKRKNNIIGYIGGPPCPDFSVGGKNLGRHGENGGLSAAYFNLIAKQHPDFFLFENVKGLWRTKKHREFYEDLKYKIRKNGYVITERLINSLEYGAPQDRDRIILIGFSKKFLTDAGLKPHQDSSLLEESFNWDQHIIYKKGRTFSYPWPKTNPFVQDSIIPCPTGIPRKLTVEYWFKKNDVLNHENAEHVFKPRQGFKRFLEVNEGDDSRKSYKRLHRWRYSPTVCYGNNEVHLHPYKARRLTVAEALSLQSLPKNFSLPPEMSLTNMFKTISNGVPYLASCGLARTIKEYIRRIA